MISPLELLLVGAAAVAAGAVNALAGGGTLITFPVLIAVGVPAVAANVTNTVALTPGYLGAAYGQARDLGGQRKRLLLFFPLGAAGGIAGGIILLNTGEQTFRTLVPFLILLASGLLAVQEPLRRWIVKRAAAAQPARAAVGSRHGSSRADASASAAGVSVDSANAPDRDTAHASPWALVAVAAAAVYGGYFGAGLGVILVAALGLTIDDTLTRLNALKQTISFATNTAAAVLFVFSGRTVWIAAAVMAIGALIGGAAGGRIASRIRPAMLRRAVVLIGTAIGIAYLVR